MSIRMIARIKPSEGTAGLSSFMQRRVRTAGLSSAMQLVSSTSSFTIPFDTAPIPMITFPSVKTMMKQKYEEPLLMRMLKPNPIEVNERGLIINYVDMNYDVFYQVICDDEELLILKNKEDKIEVYEIIEEE